MNVFLFFWLILTEVFSVWLQVSGDIRGSLRSPYESKSKETWKVFIPNATMPNYYPRPIIDDKSGEMLFVSRLEGISKELIKIDLENGAVKRLNISNNNEIFGSSVQDSDGNFYFQESVGSESRIVAINPENGEVIWEYSFGFSNPTYSNCIVEDGENRIIVVQTQMPGDEDSQYIYGIDFKTKKVLWKHFVHINFASWGTFQIFFTVDGPFVYLLNYTKDGHVTRSESYFVKIDSRDGSFIQSKTLESGVGETMFYKPVIAKSLNIVILASGVERGYYAFDTETLEILYHKEFKSKIDTFSYLVVSDDDSMVMTVHGDLWDSYVLIFDPKTGNQIFEETHFNYHCNFPLLSVMGSTEPNSFVLACSGRDENDDPDYRFIMIKDGKFYKKSDNGRGWRNGSLDSTNCVYSLWFDFSNEMTVGANKECF